MDKGRNIKLEKLKEEIDTKRESLKGDIYCDKCEEQITHRTAMKGLNGKYCPTCYLILESIEQKFIIGDLKR
jgi:formylmethanofuran dehydrogenase subunit E